APGPPADGRRATPGRPRGAHTPVPGARTPAPAHARTRHRAAAEQPGVGATAPAGTPRGVFDQDRRHARPTGPRGTLAPPGDRLPLLRHRRQPGRARPGTAAAAPLGR